MSDPTTSKPSAFEKAYEWGLDHYPNTSVFVTAVLFLTFLASLGWGLFVAVTVPRGSGWSVFFGGILFVVVTLVTWLYHRLFEVTLVSLLLIVIWYLMKLDLVLQNVHRAGSLSFAKATAVRGAQYPVFSLKELIEAKEWAEETDAAARQMGDVDGLEEWGAALASTGPISRSLFDHMRVACRLAVRSEFRSWKYERMVEANLRAATGAATIEAERQAVSEESTKRDPDRHLGFDAGEQPAREWAVHVFGKDRVPF